LEVINYPASNKATQMTKTLQPNLANLMAIAEALGIRFWLEGESIHYRAPNPITLEMRLAIVANKPALLALLGNWNAKEAIRLQIAADELVEGLGVSGSDPTIQEAACRCVEAGRQGNMARVREACAKQEARARELATARAANAA
jgi:hypothetical protein